VDKIMRDVAKNQYVFPNFFGSFFKQTAADMWESIARRNIVITDDDGKEIGLKRWLKRHGIRELGNCADFDAEPEPGSFESHVKECEDILWNERFVVYKEWKRQWYDKYLRTGYIRFLTGFVCDSIMNRKEAINYPIQGSAFHCLLWAVIRIIKEVRKKKLRAKVFAQIHDSVLARVHKNDVADYVEIAMRIMTKDIRKAWPWICVPMIAEVDVAPPGASWYEKKEYKL
jgi:hypothetical protein